MLSHAMQVRVEKIFPSSPTINVSFFSLSLIRSALGNASLDMNDLESSLDYHQRDLNLGKTKGREDAISRGLSNVGRVYARMGQFDKVCDANREVVEIFVVVVVIVFGLLVQFVSM
jgi:hypothetical protein